MQQDPMGYVDGPNTYLYATGNPAGNVDASGLFSSGNHSSITRDTIGNSGLGYHKSAIQEIAGWNTNTDIAYYFNAAYHAQDIGFVARVQAEMSYLKSLDASDPSWHGAASLDRAYGAVGVIMHILQDVYAHTDWVDGQNMIPVYRQYMTETKMEAPIQGGFGQVVIRGQPRPVGVWSDQGEAALIQRAQGNAPHGSGPFSLTNLENGNATDFRNSIFYAGGYLGFLGGKGNLHNRYATDSLGNGRASKPPYGLGVNAFRDAYKGGSAITLEFVKWMELNLEPCLLKAIKRGYGRD